MSAKMKSILVKIVSILSILCFISLWVLPILFNIDDYYDLMVYTLITLTCLELLFVLSFIIHKDFQVLMVSLFFLIFLLTRLIIELFNINLGLEILVIYSTISLLIYYLFIFSIKSFRKNITYFKMGKINKWVVLLIIGTVISCVALVFWYILFNPEVVDLENMLPTKNIVLIIFTGLLFALFNSITEEIIVRGIIWDGLSVIFKSPYIIIPLQAILFGIMHINGFPSGWIGVFLASIYGIFLGIIRYKSNGIFYPILSHFFVDLFIYYILVIMQTI